jgi:hypothetical protein
MIRATGGPDRGKVGGGRPPRTKFKAPAPPPPPSGDDSDGLHLPCLVIMAFPAAGLLIALSLLAAGAVR